MHEFALAQDIIATIGRSVTEDLEKLRVIRLEVGHFSGVVVDSLEFGLNVCLEDKGLKDVTISIQTVPAVALCECGNEYTVVDILETCPNCHSLNRKITSGADVMIKSVEVEDEADD